MNVTVYNSTSASPAASQSIPSPADPIDSAKTASLRYVNDGTPGIRRRPNGKGFVYVGADGKTICDPEELRRFKALAIPPAWRNVWISPIPNAHLQATGRDARGRKQYRYHARWREIRDQNKYDRMIAFAKVLPSIRRKVAQDLALPGLPREKVLATVVRLLESTLIRVGNQEYARDNGSFGLATMRNHHVAVSGSKIRFEFRGKSGIKHAIDLNDSRLAKIVKRCRDLPGYELFQYIGDDGERYSIGSADVNDYLRQIAGEDCSTKDFRTWAGTVLAARALYEFNAFDSPAHAKRNIVRGVESVADRLGNTKAVCRKCYIHPAIINGYTDGSLLRVLSRRVKSRAQSAKRRVQESKGSRDEAKRKERGTRREQKPQSNGNGPTREEPAAWNQVLNDGLSPEENAVMSLLQQQLKSNGAKNGRRSGKVRREARAGRRNGHVVRSAQQSKTQ
jgi:DNA topoisomerase-1